MGIPGPISTAVQELIQKLLGPAAEEYGLMLGDIARKHRLKYLFHTVNETAELLRAASIEPHSIPLRTLLPILEGASMEDEQTLSHKWAGLLASAAASPEPDAVHPSFPRILSEITPHEAVMLDRLYDLDSRTEWPAFRQRLAIDFDCSEDILNSANWNLFRLGLWSNTKDEDTSVPMVYLTSFGTVFLSATLGPTSSK